jgi:hypothetical protein
MMMASSPHFIHVNIQQDMLKDKMMVLVMVHKKGEVPSCLVGKHVCDGHATHFLEVYTPIEQA